MNQRISIIIVTFNSQFYLPDCFSSISEFLDVPAEQVEVIVVDNSVSEKDASEIRDLTNEFGSLSTFSVKYIHNEKNIGYGQGNNVGIRASSGDIICIMNPDVRFGSKILHDVFEEFQKYPNLGLLGYKQLGGFNYSFYTKPEYRNFFSGWQMKYLNKKEAFNSYKHYLSGAFFFVDKKKFESVGLFDENIFMYFEEPDIANRIQEKGYSIKYKKEKSYFHLVGDRISWSEKSFESEMSSLKYYIEKYGINKKEFVKTFLKEYQVKKLAAKLLNDKNRIEKFDKEVIKVKMIFKED